MDLEILKKFGLTNVEAVVYMEIAKIGETPIGEVIKKTGLHRGTVYNALNSLLKKGFASFVNKNGINYYRASGKKMFKSIIHDKKDELENDDLKIEKFLNEIHRLRTNTDSQQVHVSYGIPAFKNIFLDIYDECKKKNMEYLFLGEGGKMSTSVGGAYYKYTQELKKKMKIKCRVILSK
jgi:sugar-specific transcriptional regulator TrmB